MTQRSSFVLRLANEAPPLHRLRLLVLDPESISPD